MVNFYPEFVSAEVVRWVAQRDSVTRAALLADSAGAMQRRREWEAANPRPRATLAQVADHVDHLRRVVGVEHVGIGSDFDGITSVPVGLEGVDDYPALLAELMRRGWTDGDIRKLAGENVLRVFREAEKVAARLKKERPASDAAIEDLDGPAKPEVKPAG